MTTNSLAYGELSDRDLVAAVHNLAAAERGATAQLVASLAELDSRRLYLAEGFSSLFTYCTQVLHLSEHAAYRRIEAARAARRYPILLERLEAGDLTLTAIGLLAPHLTPDNHQHLIDISRHKSKREIEQLMAALRPQPPAAEPTMTAREVRPAMVKSLDVERYKVQFTVTRDTFEKLRRVQDLMRHTCPNGDVGVVFERALDVLLERLERTKSAQVLRPRQPRGATAGSRHIPAAVRRAVWERDNGQCAFVGTRGRCTERGFLEFHHIVPFADGARPRSRTLSSDVEPTINTNRISGSALPIHRLCASAPTLLAGLQLGPDRVEVALRRQRLVGTSVIRAASNV